MNFSGRSTFLIVSESSMTVSCIKKVTNGQKRSWNGRKRSCNGRKRPVMVNGCNADRSGNFETERCNALERIVRGMFMFTLQKRKNHFKIPPNEKLNKTG
jgi:hypothetical protein